MITNGAACVACVIAVISWFKSGKGNQTEYKKKISQLGEDVLLEQVNNNCLLSKVKDDTAFFITDRYTFLAGSFLIETSDVAWFYVLPEGAANLICVADKKGQFHSGKTAILSLKAELEPKVHEVLPHALIGYSKETEKQYNNRMLLQNAMTRSGFVPIGCEWWHFTLADEPYPKTYFDFPVSSAYLKR